MHSPLPEERVVEILIRKGYTVSFAESCTGGMCAARIVNVSNASAVLNVSFVTYANEAKIKYLGVDGRTISDYGVVSEQVAAQMAEGVCRQANANVGVGISGIAGPTGGSAKKPIGTVCFGFCIDGKTLTFTEHFGNIGRNNVRQASSDFVLDKIIELLK